MLRFTKLLSCILIIALAFAACGERVLYVAPTEPTGPQNPEPFNDKYFRTDYSGEEDAAFPQPFVINSADELAAYYAFSRGAFNYEQEMEDLPAMRGEVFENPDYGEDFFKTRVLLFVRLRESTSSVRHKTLYIVMESGAASVQIAKVFPNVSMAGRTEWHAVLEIDRALAEQEFKIKIDN